MIFPIATLAQIDIDISRKFDSCENFRTLGEKYHRELAFYIRDHPEMDAAKGVYKRLNNFLLKARSFDTPDYDALAESELGGA